MQFLGYTLDIIQSVNTNHELDALELLLQHGNSLLDLLLLQSFLELLGVDANGEGSTSNDLALEFDPIRCCRKAPVVASLVSIITFLRPTQSYVQQTRTTTQEMASVVVSVEPNQVAMQHTQEEFIAHRQNAIDLATGERGMQEEADLDVLLAVTNLLAQHLRQKHEVVIVDPDQIAILDLLRNGFGE